MTQKKIIGLIASLLLLLSFFLTWVSFLGFIKISGWDLISNIDQVKNMAGKDSDVFLLGLGAALIPMGAMISLIVLIINPHKQSAPVGHILSLMGTLCSYVIIGSLIIQSGNKVKIRDLIELIGAGIYVSMIGVILVIIHWSSNRTYLHGVRQPNMPYPPPGHYPDHPGYAPRPTAPPFFDPNTGQWVYPVQPPTGYVPPAATQNPVMQSAALPVQRYYDPVELPARSNTTVLIVFFLFMLLIPGCEISVRANNYETLSAYLGFYGLVSLMLMVIQVIYLVTFFTRPYPHRTLLIAKRVHLILVFVVIATVALTPFISEFSLISGVSLTIIIGTRAVEIFLVFTSIRVDKEYLGTKLNEEKKEAIRVPMPEFGELLRLGAKSICFECAKSWSRMMTGLRKRWLVLSGTVAFIASILLVYEFFIKANPTNDGRKAAADYCKCVETYNSDCDLNLGMFLNDFSKERFASRTAARSEFKAMHEGLSQKFETCKQHIEDGYRVLLSENRKQRNYESQFHIIYTNSTSGCSVNEETLRGYRDELEAKCQEIIEPYPDIAQIKSGLVGKTIGNWTINSLSEIIELAVTAEYPTDYRYQVALDITLRDNTGNSPTAKARSLYYLNDGSWILEKVICEEIKYVFNAPVDDWFTLSTPSSFNFSFQSEKVWVSTPSMWSSIKCGTDVGYQAIRGGTTISFKSRENNRTAKVTFTLNPKSDQGLSAFVAESVQTEITTEERPVKYTPTSGIYLVVGDKVNIRDYPQKAGQGIIGVLSIDATGPITGKHVDDRGIEWYRTNYNGRVAWISGLFAIEKSSFDEQPQRALSRNSTVYSWRDTYFKETGVVLDAGTRYRFIRSFNGYSCIQYYTKSGKKVIAWVSDSVLL